jgi:hypothetical protein
VALGETEMVFALKTAEAAGRAIGNQRHRPPIMSLPRAAHKRRDGQSGKIYHLLVLAIRRRMRHHRNVPPQRHCLVTIRFDPGSSRRRSMRPRYTRRPCSA